MRSSRMGVMSGPGVVGGDGADDGTDAVADAALGSCLELLTALGARPGFAFSDGEVLENLRAVHRLVAVAESVRLRLVEELRTRPGAVPGSGVAGGARRFLTEALHVTPGQANLDLASAQAAYSPA